MAKSGKKKSTFRQLGVLLRQPRAFSTPVHSSKSEDGAGALSRRCSPCHALRRGPAHLQPSPFAFSPPAPLVIIFLPMLHHHHKFSDTSSGPRSTPATFKHILLCGAVVGPGGASMLGPLETLYTQAPGLVPRPGAFSWQYTPHATCALSVYPPLCAHI